MGGEGKQNNFQTALDKELIFINGINFLILKSFSSYNYIKQHPHQGMDNIH